MVIPSISAPLNFGANRRRPVISPSVRFVCTSGNTVFRVLLNSNILRSPRKLLDVSKAKKLGWKYKTELRDGIRLAYEDFLNNPVRAER